MADYQQGKIYKMFVGDVVYIGSTTQPLVNRLSDHKSEYKRWTNGKSTNCYSNFELYKLGVPKIELIELFPCNIRKELEMREGHFIKEMNCINKNIAGRTRKESIDAYRNKEEVKEKQKLYMKAYYEANKEKILEKNRQKKLKGQAP